MTRLLVLLVIGAALWVAPAHAGGERSTQALQILRTVAGLETGAVSVDCDTRLDARDALYLLREEAGLPNAECVPTRDTRASLQNEAIAYWNAPQLYDVPVYWSLKGTVYDGLAGYGTPEFVAVCGECINTWGYDWLLGVLIHEYGHALGYVHGDPVCTMNEAYC